MRRMESALDRGPGSMSGIPGELAPASATGWLAARTLEASRWLPAAAVIALTLVAFLPVLGNGFIPNWGDALNFLDNPHYRGLGPAQLRWMFTTFHAGHYIPLTWLSLGLDYLLWGLHPVGYHLTSLLLHAAAALCFYFLALRLLRLSLPPAPSPAALRWGAALVALLFPIHPLRVESVASATERRDVLSGLFYVLALLCYLKARCRSATWDWGFGPSSPCTGSPSTFSRPSCPSTSPRSTRCSPPSPGGTSPSSPAPPRWPC